MRRRLHNIRICFWSAVFLLTVMSLTFIAMPIANYVNEGYQRVLLISVGIVFWSSLIGGYIFCFVAYRIHKTILQRDLLKMGLDRKVLGILNVFTNTPASIADAMFIAGLAVMITIAVSGRMRGFLPYILLAILIFSANMHCLFNGNIYRTTKISITRRKRNEKKSKE